MRAGLIDGADSRDLRRRVLRPHLSATDELPGDDRPDAVHIGLVDDRGTVLSTCLLQPERCYWRTGPDADAAWQLRQMATEPSGQGKGYGAFVLDAAIDYLTGAGVPMLWCHARETAAGFYTAHGFHTEGEVYVPAADLPIPHLHMWRELPAATGPFTR